MGYLWVFHLVDMAHVSSAKISVARRPAHWGSSMCVYSVPLSLTAGLCRPRRPPQRWPIGLCSHSGEAVWACELSGTAHSRHCASGRAGSFFRIFSMDRLDVETAFRARRFFEPGSLWLSWTEKSHLETSCVVSLDNVTMVCFLSRSLLGVLSVMHIFTYKTRSARQSLWLVVVWELRMKRELLLFDVRRVFSPRRLSNGMEARGCGAEDVRDVKVFGSRWAVTFQWIQPR